MRPPNEPLRPIYLPVFLTKEERKKLRRQNRREAWKEEVLSHEALFIKIYDRLPKEMLAVRELLLSSLWRSPAKWEIHHESSHD